MLMKESKLVYIPSFSHSLDISSLPTELSTMLGAFQVLSCLKPVRWVLLFPLYMLRNKGSEGFGNLLRIPQLISIRLRINTS